MSGAILLLRYMGNNRPPHDPVLGMITAILAVVVAVASLASVVWFGFPNG